MNDVLAQLAAILEQRKGSDPAASYVAGLYQGGLDHILKKIGEEAAETIIAAKNDDNEQLVYEMADLWFHSLILLAARDLGPADVLDELMRRFGKSGLSEKAERGQK